MPSRPGISTSMITTSGSLSMATSMADSPSWTTATTDRSLLLLHGGAECLRERPVIVGDHHADAGATLLLRWFRMGYRALRADCYLPAAPTFQHPRQVDPSSYRSVTFGAPRNRQEREPRGPTGWQGRRGHRRWPRHRPGHRRAIRAGGRHGRRQRCRPGSRRGDRGGHQGGRRRGPGLHRQHGRARPGPPDDVQGRPTRSEASTSWSTTPASPGTRPSTTSTTRSGTSSWT